MRKNTSVGYSLKVILLSIIIFNHHLFALWLGRRKKRVARAENIHRSQAPRCCFFFSSLLLRFVWLRAAAGSSVVVARMTARPDSWKRIFRAVCTQQLRNTRTPVAREGERSCLCCYATLTHRHTSTHGVCLHCVSCCMHTAPGRRPDLLYGLYDSRETRPGSPVSPGNPKAS